MMRTLLQGWVTPPWIHLPLIIISTRWSPLHNSLTCNPRCLCSTRQDSKSLSACPVSPRHCNWYSRTPGSGNTDIPTRQLCIMSPVVSHQYPNFVRLLEQKITRKKKKKKKKFEPRLRFCTEFQPFDPFSLHKINGSAQNVTRQQTVGTLTSLSMS